MPTRFRTLIGALGVFVALSGVVALWTGSQLSGWPLVRGVSGAIIAIALGVRLILMAVREDWPAWLASAMGDGDAT
jgi:hypothetical protein